MQLGQRNQYKEPLNKGCFVLMRFEGMCFRKIQTDIIQNFHKSYTHDFEQIEGF